MAATGEAKAGSKCGSLPRRRLASKLAPTSKSVIHTSPTTV